MPETSMNIYNLLKPGEHEIGYARKVSAMKPKAEAKPVGYASDNQLRFRVSVANGGHVSASLGSCMDISHIYLK